jgi:hypothetical protein
MWRSPHPTATSKPGNSAMAKRPDHVKPPAHLSPNTPVPEPQPADRRADADPLGRDPTRYGDWEKKGVAVDF